MGITFPATQIAIGALLLLMSMQSAAKADQITITGQTNSPVCSRVAAQCAAVTFTLSLTTQLDHNTYGVVYDVTALQGILDGKYSIVGTGGWLLPVTGNPQSPIPYGSISYTLD